MAKSKSKKNVNCVEDEDNNVLKSLLNLIPPVFYFDDEYKEIINCSIENDVKHTLTNNKRSPKHLKPLQSLSVTELQSKIIDNDVEINEEKHIFAKPNPLVNRVSELKRKRNNSEANSEISEKSARVDDSDSDVEMISDEEDAGLGSSIDSYDLHDLLHSRIDALQAKRKHMKGDDVGLEKKRLARRVSKMKLKLKRKTLKHNKERAPALTPKLKKENTTQKPIFNQEGKIVFSKFDFGKKENSTGSKQNKKQVNALTGKNYKQILQTVERRKEKIDKLKSEGKLEKAATIEKKQQWNAAIQKSEGIKLKDNTDLLKKSIKRKEQIVNKKSKEWKERIYRVKEKGDDRIKKREKNISDKKKGNKDNKMKKLKKRGRYVPGF